MESNLFTQINEKRRKSLIRFTFLSVLAYHTPIGVGYVAHVMGMASYSLSELSQIYMAVLAANLVFLGVIRAKRTISPLFVNLSLYVQISTCMVLMTWTFFLMGDLRYMTLLTTQSAVIFVFIQCSLPVSILIIGVVLVDYLFVALFANGFDLHAMPLRLDLMMVLIYVVCSIFVAFMCRILRKQQKVIRKSRDQMRVTFRELDEAHSQLKSNNRHMMRSLRYAEVIQRAILPGTTHLKIDTPESLVIWMPKEIVGGDVYYTFTSPGKSIVVLMDCTGHGVPGAFLTLITYTEIRKIVLDQACYDPAEILKRLNRSLKHTLHKNSDEPLLTGMDGLILDVDHTDCRVRFAGAEMAVYVVSKGRVEEIKGDRQSLGYESSREDFQYTNHTLELHHGDCLYMKTDGLTDQLGGHKRLRFGTKRFKAALEEIHALPFEKQRREIMDRFRDYKGKNEQIDDITVIGFRM